MNDKKGWAWETGFALFFGVPVYLSGFFAIGFHTSFLVHIGLIVAYGGLLLMFGRGSAVEVGVFVAIIAVLVSMLLPIFQRAELNEQRRRQHQKVTRPH